MDSLNNAPGMELPPPVEQDPAINLSPEAPQSAVEQANPAAAERTPGVQAPGAAMPAMPIPFPTSLPMPPAQHDVPATTQTASLQASDDNDLIEKEWVNKAKQIVERTRDDPYKQSEELTVVKIDYMKKRYNKTIKLNK